MNRITSFAFSCLLLLAFSCSVNDTQIAYDPVDLVNPLAGTASTYELSTGNTYPAIALP